MPSQNPVLRSPSGLQTINGSITILGNLIVTGTINGGPVLYTVAYAPAIIFDGNLGGSFKITLTGDVTSSSIANMASKLVVPIRIAQDNVGGRAFTWPAGTRNHGEISPAPNAVSLQFFALDSDGNLDASSIMQYS